ncbi:Putative membrane protein (TMS3) [Streptococcus sp. HSISS3]|nr:Putative membrane protein (TMS3) [Streptococcus sp. HSISS3]
MDSTSFTKTYQWIFQVIYLLIFSGLIWFNLRHGDMIVIATALSWLTVVCELWLYSKH